MSQVLIIALQTAYNSAHLHVGYTMVCGSPIHFSLCASNSRHSCSI